MADEEGFLEDDVVAGGQDVEVGQKVGFLPAIALKILKWVAVAVAAVIFIVTVVIFTMRFMNRGGRGAAVPQVTSEYTSVPPILSYYDNFDDIRTRTADETPYTVIARVALGYEEGNKSIQGELVSRTALLQDLIRSYFTSRTAAQVQPKNEDIVKEELRERVNSVMRTGKIQRVIFLEYNVLPL